MRTEPPPPSVPRAPSLTWPQPVSQVPRDDFSFEGPEANHPCLLLPGPPRHLPRDLALGPLAECTERATSSFPGPLQQEEGVRDCRWVSGANTKVFKLP